MGLLEEEGERIARRAFEAEQRYGDPTIPEEIAKSIGATSTTLQESYSTALRILRAGHRGEALLDRIVAAREEGRVVTSTESKLEDDPSTRHLGG